MSLKRREKNECRLMRRKEKEERREKRKKKEKQTSLRSGSSSTAFYNKELLSKRFNFYFIHYLFIYLFIYDFFMIIYYFIYFYFKQLPIFLSFSHLSSSLSLLSLLPNYFIFILPFSPLSLSLSLFSVSLFSFSFSFLLPVAQSPREFQQRPRKFNSEQNCYLILLLF